MPLEERPARSDRTDQLSFLWREITGRCQLTCRHCYADSGPRGTHGSMTGEDWKRVIDEAARLGVGHVQFIGGEPTLHPALPDLVRHARRRGIEVEVFSNLVRVPEALWETFELHGVCLATSYYSSRAIEHDAITGRRSHDRTLRNLREALRRGIPIRVGVVDVQERQGVDDAVAELRAMGVEEVGVDHLRQVGRGVRGGGPDVEQLCGRCADGCLAISPSGDVWPCVFSRWLTVGNVRSTTLREIDMAAAPIRAELRRRFGLRDRARPGRCEPYCRPCHPNCEPRFQCPPKQGDGDPHGCPPRRDCPPWE
ncbi:MAG TPA: radical SAM protein [Candidatus Dormibacteraeota bacterium]|nr:radical SAM protein [Candidatus Dormibacteraeota bacterium]